MKTKESSVDPFVYHVSICGKTSFKNYENMKIIQIMINIHKPKPIYIFGRSLLENNVENYIHAFMHLCLDRVCFLCCGKKRVSGCITVMREVSQQNGFIINQINKLTIKNYSNLSKINILYYLKF